MITLLRKRGQREDSSFPSPANVLNIGFSSRAKVTPTDICNSLQRGKLVRHCQPGTPWNFEVTRHQSQWTFEPTGCEILQCYTVNDGVARVPRVFKGAIAQFGSYDDLPAGLARIQEQNHRNSRALRANVIRADTTLDQYAVYALPKHLTLMIVPVVEGGDEMRRRLEEFGRSVF